MPRIIEPKSDRLQLRQWQSSDRAPFAAMSMDLAVMEYFPSTLDRSQSDAFADKSEALIAEQGWGFWAAQRIDTREFIGFIGLHIPKADLPFSPCVEIGWRLARAHWGKGYATEGAALALKIGFEQLDLEEIVSFAVAGNHRSRAVMERLQMTDTRQNFDHPDVLEPSHLREHCLYKISRDRWMESVAFDTDHF